MSRGVSLACGSAGARDRIDVAVDAIERGDVNYVGFDVMSEMTMGAQEMRKRVDASTGYDQLLVQRMRHVLPVARRSGVRLIGNFGAANPTGATDTVVGVCRELGLVDTKVATIFGDDVTELVRTDFESYFPGGLVSKDSLLSANAYLGSVPIAEALGAGANIVIAGRVSDSSLYLGPLMHEFGWDESDWDRLGAGAIIGHLLECGALATGANWTDGSARPVPGLARVGAPIADVSDNLDVKLRRPAGTGGLTSVTNFSAQLMHEINDPTAYLTPDVTANLLSISFAQENAEHVRVEWTVGPRGRERPARLKVLAAFHDGYLGEVLIFLPGPGAAARAEILEQIARERMLEVLDLPLKRLRFDLLGVPPGVPAGDFGMVLRMAGIAATREVAEELVRFAEYVIMVGPTGMGERRGAISSLIRVLPTFIDRSAVKTHVEIRAVNGHGG